MKEYYSIALDIAEEAHKGQKRTNGEDYIEHPKRVAAKFEDDYRKCLAILHDVLEPDAARVFLYDELIYRGIDKEIADGVLILTRKEGENYFDFIMRIVNSTFKRRRESGSVWKGGDFQDGPANVKIEDINDNSKTCKEGSRLDKYRLSKYVIESSIYH